MHKLKHKQLLHLTNGKHHDGKGLYISILSQGRGKWSYRYRIDNKSREMGLGTFPEISIVDARQKAEDKMKSILKKLLEVLGLKLIMFGIFMGHLKSLN